MVDLNYCQQCKKSGLEKNTIMGQAVEKAELVKLTNDAFNQLSINESEKVLFWAQATKN